MRQESKHSSPGTKHIYIYIYTHKLNEYLYLRLYLRTKTDKVSEKQCLLLCFLNTTLWAECRKDVQLNMIGNRKKNLEVIGKKNYVCLG
jgi:hypothetical protein